jgi:hypothetical protein
MHARRWARHHMAVFAAAAGLLAAFGASARAQSGPSAVQRWDLVVGGGPDIVIGGLGLARLWPVVAEGRVRLGLGARWTAFLGGEQRLGALAERQGPGGLVRDSLIGPQGWANAMNLAGHFALQATDRLAFGANLDLLGLTWGTTQVATLRLAGGAGPAAGSRVTTNPPLWNRFGGGTGDRGTLASEFWIGWDVRRDVRLRVGLHHFVVQQTTPSAAPDGNTEYRRFGNAVFVGLGRLVR